MKLFPSTLLIHPTTADLSSLLHHSGHDQIENNPDILLIDDYTISSIRSISKFLLQAPLSHSCSIVLIPEADRLLTESQNALLKVLEEPGDNRHLILTTARPQKLLPTILSRCHQINFSQNQLQHPQFPPLPTPQTPLEAISATDQLASDKATTLSYLDEKLRQAQQNLVAHPNPRQKNLVEQLNKAVLLINANVDSKSALDYLFLSTISSA